MQALADCIIAEAFEILVDQAHHIDFQATDRFHQRALKVRRNAHDLAGRLSGSQEPLGVLEFIKRPLRNLHNTIVQCRFKAGVCLFCNCIWDLIQRISQCNF